MSARVLVAATLLVVIAACGEEDVAEPAPPAATSATTVPSTPVPPSTTGPVPVTAVYADVGFYPACGNETLEHEGVIWYQVHEADEPEVWATIVGVERAEPAAPVGFRAAARVVEPGPGDDIGTLVVWADGVARFVSESGDLTAWLVDDELSYGWVC